jgi:hypothetical protein
MEGCPGGNWRFVESNKSDMDDVEAFAGTIFRPAMRSRN